MNQIEIQQEIRKERTLDKARVIATAKRVRRSQCNRNIWLVGSGNPRTPTKFYCVQWNDIADCFMCDCPAFGFSSDYTCKHIYSCAFAEGGLA
jgi:hypothetical protein